jgi:hypothetical protein
MERTYEEITGNTRGKSMRNQAPGDRSERAARAAQLKALKQPGDKAAVHGLDIRADAQNISLLDL